MTSHITDYSLANHKTFFLEAAEKSADLSFISDQTSNSCLFCQGFLGSLRQFSCCTFVICDVTLLF